MVWSLTCRGASGITGTWATQAVYDESFVYLRFEGGVALPTTGQEVADQFVPGIPIMPILEIEVVPVQAQESPETRFMVTIGDVTTQKPSFVETGKATSTRYFMNYSLALQDSEGEPIFHNFADSLARLIEVDARFIEVKIPWGSLGMGNEDAARVILHDRFGPLLPYEIRRFP